MSASLTSCRAQDQKVFLMLESGVRFHSTKFSRDKSEVPSVFCMKVGELPLRARVDRAC